MFLLSDLFKRILLTPRLDNMQRLMITWTWVVQMTVGVAMAVENRLVGQLRAHAVGHLAYGTVLHNKSCMTKKKAWMW